MKKLIALTVVGFAAASSLAFADGPFAGNGPRHGAMLERLKAADTNGDGMISKAEAAALPRLAERFDAIDTNHDGQLTKDEMRAFHEAQRGSHGKALLGPDGKITRDAFLAKAAARFDAMDTNKDGVVTADELKAAHRNHTRGAKQ